MLHLIVSSRHLSAAEAEGGGEGGGVIIIIAGVSPVTGKETFPSAL